MNCRKIYGKFRKYLEAGNTLLRGTLIREGINIETKRYLELKVLYIMYHIYNTHTYIILYQNLWDTANTVVRGKSIALNIHLRKEKSLKSMTSASTLRNLGLKAFALCSYKSMQQTFWVYCTQNHSPFRPWGSLSNSGQACRPGSLSLGMSTLWESLTFHTPSYIS